MDEKGHASGHLMLMTPERVFYAGLLGRPRGALLWRVPYLYATFKPEGVSPSA